MYKINQKQKQKQEQDPSCKISYNQIVNSQQNSLENDINKMHILPPHCPMTPHSYSDFFNDKLKLHKVEPYKIKFVNHPKDGKQITTIEYNNFYRDFKKDALNYNTPEMEEYNPNNHNNHNNPNNSNSNNSNITQNTILKNTLGSENIQIYKDTKNKTNFAVPMKSNGSNKLEHIYNDCLNKSTFEYKRFGYDNTLKHNSNADNWVDNPIYNIDISEDTDILYNDYMNNIENNASNIYNSVFEDMYILGYNPSNST